MTDEIVLGETEEVSAIDQILSEPEPETAEQVEQAEADRQSLIMTAAMAVNFTASTAESIWPCLSYDESLRAAAVEKLMPVLSKYGMEMPEWLKPYKEELEAGLFFGGIIFKSYIDIKAFNKAEAEKEEKEAEKNGNKPEQFTA